jgi:hypothetical protein
MGRQVAGVLYALAMAAVIVGVDLAFFRNRFLERLMVNVGICPGVRSFLLEILQAFMTATEAVAVQRVDRVGLVQPVRTTPGRPSGGGA